MTAPAKRPFSRVVQALLILAALALIVNPELRALLFFTNALGFEVVGILFALQLRALFDLAPETLHPAAFACNLASRLGYVALVAYSRAVSFRVYNRLFCPVLITISYGLCCQPSNNRWRDRESR
jgi:hypothetical protein